jgi:hypothetical protein
MSLEGLTGRRRTPYSVTVRVVDGSENADAALKQMVEARFGAGTAAGMTLLVEGPYADARTAVRARKKVVANVSAAEAEERAAAYSAAMCVCRAGGRRVGGRGKGCDLRGWRTVTLIRPPDCLTDLMRHRRRRDRVLQERGHDHPAGDGAGHELPAHVRH